MIFKDQHLTDYQLELEHAVEARSQGNEGMSRVCARRAVGILVGEYLNRRGYGELPHSAYERLTLFSSLPEIDERCRVVAGHFLLKVDRNRNLPEEVDLIQDLIFLEKYILRFPNQ